METLLFAGQKLASRGSAQTFSSHSVTMRSQTQCAEVSRLKDSCIVDYVIEPVN